ncbi:hypothetical protein I551_8878 [Mycobacterium ulcerans str. Harvey]|uniref:DivIVA domain-containing protein n=1 Tax=Mycobacterium ulcerans str. Harvey TaxID=1299332 RepID=A0ABN0R9K4_MYCUL|nr:hypothetical protein I551_8878 [Mycobacterium ulcerans str. Harvey]
MAIDDYTSGALDGYDKKDIEGLLTDRLDQARDNLDEALERIRALVDQLHHLRTRCSTSNTSARSNRGSRATQRQRAKAR